MCKLFSVKHEGFWCYTCRKGTRRFKQLEFMVQTHLDQHPLLSMYTYYDQTLPCAPNNRRPDFTYILADRIIILEVDEDAHRYYARGCETARITELMEQAGTKPLLLLRFNPTKTRLPEMQSALLRMMDMPIDRLLHVEFIGYNEKAYDVIADIERLGQQMILAM